ncbi:MULTISPECIES: alpha-glucosidase [unclassified Bacillus (in: firmicutes)]|uniref:glycoside hydrolase family 13 protein n=1 Tax=unclassified Bacillus (in: firmicutes) TaxID=185979 RepID=UPI0008E11833|nr:MULTISPECIES: alpha-glucosidase [unclassified Bacillus (in: firmicutes)]SFB20016.1 oligo-1,6-glucosidase [Bacillus sp. UNCCL13]SFQ90802.1 oligo-1,6-glucosidase [Bacillus sp. cl95]
MEMKWWNESVVYQVYWRSFYDTDGDGYGDLRGVIEKLDYISELGVDVIWLNPFYVSPDKDNGYDISDYYSIMPKAGTLQDFEELIAEAKKRNMKIIMDLVVNHTSNEHPWFKESRSSKDNPKRDWYIWRDGKDGNPPNNWRSYFCPSTWEYDEETEQYFFHSFAVEQPDLNWENKEVREAIYQMMHFWLQKGISGFRLDAIALLAKSAGYPDAEEPDDIRYLTNNPGVHDYLQEMNKMVFSQYDALTVGEVAFVSPEEGLLYVDESRKELDTLFHFEVCDEMPTWDLKRFKEIQKRWYEGLWGKGWNSQFLNNHDHTRLVTRYGNDAEYRVESAKLFAAMLHSLPGMPYIYQGEEIGMTGVRFDDINDYNDIAMKNKYAELTANGQDPQEVLEQLQPLSRDNSRTPMQWDGSEHAGFTNGKPWINVNPNHLEINVEAALSDKDSIFYFYQKLIKLRKKHLVFVYGDYTPMMEEDENLYSYMRTYQDESILFVGNFSETNQTVSLPEIEEENLLISNYGTEASEENQAIVLKPYEVRIYLV